MQVPGQWKPAVSVIAAIVAVATATVALGGYVRAVADDATAPFRAEIQAYKAHEKEWHEEQQRRLDRIEEKLDRLIERR